MEEEKNTSSKSPQALREESVLAFWAENNIFDVSKRCPKG